MIIINAADDYESFNQKNYNFEEENYVKWI